MASPSVAASADLCDSIADSLLQEGFCVLQGVFPPEMLRTLSRRVHDLSEQQFKSAGTGRRGLYSAKSRARTDDIHWLSPDQPEERVFLDWMESLRTGLNQRLFLGLFVFESHFARYQVGGFYKKHVDAFVGESNRQVSIVLYLNEDWHPDDGGELLLYAHEAEEPLLRVYPDYGTLVVFLSERFPHEVLPAGRERISIAGWYRVRRDQPLNTDVV